MSQPGSVRGSLSNLSKPNNASGSKLNLNQGGRSSRLGSLSNIANNKDHDMVVPVVQKNVQYENTYQLKPTKKFQSEAVKKVCQEILESKLSKIKYDQNTTGDLIRTLTDEILAAVKKMTFDRYKLIVDVSIGEFKGQGIRVGSRCIWDTTTDNFASVSFKNLMMKMKD